MQLRMTRTLHRGHLPLFERRQLSLTSRCTIDSFEMDLPYISGSSDLIKSFHLSGRSAIFGYLRSAFSSKKSIHDLRNLEPLRREIKRQPSLHFILPRERCARKHAGPTMALGSV